ncbi:MAG: type VI secretion system tip protein VgrG [Pseudomonadota bacterium]
MAASPEDQSDDPVGIKITANGKASADDLVVIAVRTRAEMNRVPEAVIVIADGDVADNSFPVTDASTFAVGTEVKVEAFYGGGTASTIFDGIVTALRLRVLDSRGSRLEITLRDKAVKLTLAPATATYLKQTDSAVISKIVEDAGLTADVSSTATEHDAVVQYFAMPWDFILSLAEANGLLVWAEAGKVFAKAPDTSASQVLTVTYGEDLIRFDAEVSLRGQFDSVDATAWSLSELATTDGSADPEPPGKWGTDKGSALADAAGGLTFPIATPIQIEASDLTSLAKARQTRSALAMIQGTAAFQGSGLAVLGATLELKGLADRFNGTGLICAVAHRVEDGQWTTEVALGHPHRWLADRPGLATASASALTAPIEGLQVGLVKQVAEDPNGQAMIEITVPMLGEEADPLWARYNAPYASGDAGVMFLPEVGDEVFVAFLNSDPRYPVVLGSVHSSKNAQPVAPETANNIKVIQTREKLKVNFDDENKVITVETPGGNSVTLSDQDQSITLKDQNGNSVEMSSSGITLNSASDVSITAAASVSISGSSGVTISSDADVSISGLNVSASADVGFSASGNASAELTASGQVTVQGALVNIN